MPNDTAKSDEYNNGTSVRVRTQCYISACIYMTPIEIVRVPLSNSKPEDYDPDSSREFKSSNLGKPGRRAQDYDPDSSRTFKSRKPGKPG